MTTIQIQEALKNALEKDVFANLQLFGNKSVQVFIQDTPLSQDYEYDTDSEAAEKYYPCIVIKAVNGEVAKQNAPQITRIEIFAISKDWSEDMSGYKDVTIMLDKVRDYLVSHDGIHGAARMQYPLKWQMIDDDYPLPYWEGSLTTHWAVYVKPYEDIEQIL